jgi:hypothetical protein
MVAISTGVRNALSSLQSVQSQSQVAQQHLATGRKVNSAVDNAVNYLTAAGLNDRSSQLSGLLDGMSNAVQTINAASKGIDGITKLVQSAQSTIKQAQADAVANRPTATGTALATAGEVTATGKSLKDIALNKVVVDNNASGADNAATASSAGNLGVATATTKLSISVKAGSTTFSTQLDATATVRDVVNAINSSGVATASVDDSGKLNVTGTGSSTLYVGIGAGTGATAAADADTDAASGGQNTLFGLTAAQASSGAGIASAGGSSSVRANLVQQFNDLSKQIDQMAKDAGYNGTNLLDGNKMSVVFNEKTGTSQNKLDIQGQTVTAANLGIGTAATSSGAGKVNFQDDSELANAGQALTNALSSLKSIASGFGSNLAVVQARQDFTKSMIDTLSTGADNLVNADQNQEAATLLALQTRQQLSQTSLSLSNQADQGILRLF